jgi:hypothetical protein
MWRRRLRRDVHALAVHPVLAGPAGRAGPQVPGLPRGRGRVAAATLSHRGRSAPARRSQPPPRAQPLPDLLLQTHRGDRTAPAGEKKISVHGEKSMRVYLNSYMYDGVWDESTKQHNLACAARQSRRKQKGAPFDCNESQRKALYAELPPFALNFPPCTENPPYAEIPMRCQRSPSPACRSKPQSAPAGTHVCVRASIS